MTKTENRGNEQAWMGRRWINVTCGEFEEYVTLCVQVYKSAAHQGAVGWQEISGIIKE